MIISNWLLEGNRFLRRDTVLDLVQALES